MKKHDLKIKPVLMSGLAFRVVHKYNSKLL